MGKLLQKYGIPVYPQNPSLMPAEDISKRRRIESGDGRRTVTLDGETGEVLRRGTAVFTEWEDVDKERFVKIFLAGLKQAVGMSKPGMLVFEHVYDQLRDNHQKDMVMLAPDACGMTTSAFSRGLRDLLEREFLYRSPYNSVFWVNIRYLFNGDRIAFVRAYRIKRPTPAPVNQPSLFDAAEPAAENA